MIELPNWELMKKFLNLYVLKSTSREAQGRPTKVFFSYCILSEVHSMEMLKL